LGQSIEGRGMAGESEVHGLRKYVKRGKGGSMFLNG
jgi:hypothetical protein